MESDCASFGEIEMYFLPYLFGFWNWSSVIILIKAYGCMLYQSCFSSLWTVSLSLSSILKIDYKSNLLTIHQLNFLSNNYNLN